MIKTIYIRSQDSGFTQKTIHRNRQIADLNQKIDSTGEPEQIQKQGILTKSGTKRTDKRKMDKIR